LELAVVFFILEVFVHGHFLFFFIILETLPHFIRRKLRLEQAFKANHVPCRVHLGSCPSRSNRENTRAVLLLAIEAAAMASLLSSDDEDVKCSSVLRLRRVFFVRRTRY
jgi:hypothetical protein